MNCRQFHKRLHRYLAKALPAGAGADMEAHAADCEECAGALTAAQQVLELLHTLPAPRPPEGLASRVKATVRAAATPSRVAPRPWALSPVGLATACAGLLIVASVLLFSYRVSRPAVPTSHVASAPPLEVAVTRPIEEPAIDTVPTLVEAPMPTTDELAVTPYRPTAVTGVSSPIKLASARPESEPLLAAVSPSVAAEEAEAPAEPIITPAVSRAADVEVQMASPARAEIPLNIAEARMRTAPVAKSVPAGAPTVEVAEYPDLTEALIGGVIADMIVNTYVRETIIAGEENLLSLATSTPVVASPTLSATNGIEKPDIE